MVDRWSTYYWIGYLLFCTNLVISREIFLQPAKLPPQHEKQDISSVTTKPKIKMKRYKIKSIPEFSAATIASLKTPTVVPTLKAKGKPKLITTKTRAVETLITKPSSSSPSSTFATTLEIRKEVTRVLSSAKITAAATTTKPLPSTTATIISLLFLQVMKLPEETIITSSPVPTGLPAETSTNSISLDDSLTTLPHISTTDMDFSRTKDNPQSGPATIISLHLPPVPISQSQTNPLGENSQQNNRTQEYISIVIRKNNEDLMALIRRREDIIKERKSNDTCPFEVPKHLMLVQMPYEDYKEIKEKYPTDVQIFDANDFELLLKSEHVKHKKNNSTAEKLKWSMFQYRVPVIIIAVVILATTSYIVSCVVDKVYSIYKDEWAIREDVSDITLNTKELIRERIRLESNDGKLETRMTGVLVKRYLGIWKRKASVKEEPNSRGHDREAGFQNAENTEADTSSPPESCTVPHVVVIEVANNQNPSNGDSGDP